MRMQPSESAVELDCRKEGMDLVEYPLYRIIQALYTLLSLTSLPLLLFVGFKYIICSTFHRNVKIILLVYYSMALFQSMAYSSAEIYMVTSSLVNKPCDFFPPFYIYAHFHLATFLSHRGMILSLMAMCVERSVATMRSSKYESNGVFLGLFLFALTVVGAVATASFVYDIDDFGVKVYSMNVVPPSAVSKFNMIAMVLVSVSFFCMITFLALSRFNKKLCSIGTVTLTSRYQTRENVVTTQFAARIATLQVCFIIFYEASGILVRVFGPGLFSKRLYTSVRHMCFVNPIFTIVLPIYSIHILKYYRSNRDSNIRSVVMMESRGAAGTRNYEEAIGKAWQFNQQP